MQKLLFTVHFVLLSVISYAQGADYVSAFQPGYYYTHTGQKIEGLLRHNYNARWSEQPDNSITFKSAKKSKKITLSTSEVKAFVIGLDSFAIVKNFEINGLAYYKEDFVKVVKVGKMKLYLHASTGGNPGSMTYHEVFTYLVEKDGQLLRMKKRDFKDQMVNLVADYKALQTKIQAKQLQYDQLEQIIEEYNNWFTKQKI